MIHPIVSISARIAIVVASCLTISCTTPRDSVTQQPGTSPAARLVTTGPGVRLEVLDWGGRGVPLVFLAGSGNSAHVFDEFAPQLADSFHVIGITRRGYGASAEAPPPTDLDTLVADIATVLDSLGVRRGILVGHSIAGEELTRFAELYPDRCAGLIYLDAAYDRSMLDTLASQQPSQPLPRITPADTANLTSIEALYARIEGVREPRSEIRATARFDANDRYLGQVTADSLKARLASSGRVARYDRVRCPALGIFVVADSLADVVPYYAELNAQERAQGDKLLRFVQAVVTDGHNRFARFSQNEVVDIRGGNHFIFLQRPREVAAIMRRYLGERSRRR